MSVLYILAHTVHIYRAVNNYKLYSYCIILYYILYIGIFCFPIIATVNLKRNISGNSNIFIYCNTNYNKSQKYKYKNELYMYTYINN